MNVRSDSTVPGSDTWNERTLREPPALLDASYYRDPVQYQREVELIFYRSWLPVCPASDVAIPRSYVVWEQLGQSVVIARLDSGGVSAWHNVCQHRGAKLLRESGRCDSGTVRCPWHGFGYDLEGKVTRVPLRESFDAAELAGLRAPQVAVREVWGFVWICLTEPSLTLEDYLGPLLPELGWYGFEEFETRFRDQWHIAANWKTIVDGFNETWHVPFTHKDTLSEFVLWREAHLRDLGPHSMMTIPIKRNSSSPPPLDANPQATMLCHYLSFPNTIFSCFPTHLQMFTAWPLNARESVLCAWGISGPTPSGMSDDEWHQRGTRDWNHFLHVVEQDLEVLDDAGKVYDSLGFKRNMFNREEGRLTAFHRTIDRILSGQPMHA